MRCKGLVLRRHRYARLLRQGWSSAVPHMQHRGASDTTGTILKSKRTIQAVAIVCIHSVPNIPYVHLCAWPMPKSKLCGFTTKISRNVSACCWASTQPQCSGPFGCRFFLLPANKESNEWSCTAAASKNVDLLWARSRGQRHICQQNSTDGLQASRRADAVFWNEVPMADCDGHTLSPLLLQSGYLVKFLGSLHRPSARFVQPFFFHFVFLFFPLFVKIIFGITAFHTRRAAFLIFSSSKKTTFSHLGFLYIELRLIFRAEACPSAPVPFCQFFAFGLGFLACILFEA